MSGIHHLFFRITNKYIFSTSLIWNYIFATCSEQTETMHIPPTLLCKQALLLTYAAIYALLKT